MSDLEKAREEIKAAKKRVSVSCDEYHAHSATEGCLSGDPRDIAICILRERVRELERAIGDLAKLIENGGSGE